jgi:hypothetical protein
MAEIILGFITFKIMCDAPTLRPRWLPLLVKRLILSWRQMKLNIYSDFFYAIQKSIEYLVNLLASSYDFNDFIR